MDGPAIGPLRDVAAVGVAVPVANALAVGIASMLTGTATSSRGKVEKQFPPKVKPFLFSQLVLSLTLFTMRLEVAP